MVGASDAADICRRAISVAYPAGLPATPEAISAGAEELAAGTLEEFDEDFLTYPNDLTELLFAHVSEHPDRSEPCRNMTTDEADVAGRVPSICVDPAAGKRLCARDRPRDRSHPYVPEHVWFDARGTACSGRL
jgi:hypothetical protein